MADETPTPDQSTTPPDGTPANPINVTFVPGGVPGGPTTPLRGLDETQPGGLYQVRGQWVDAEGNPTKPKK